MAKYSAFNLAVQVDQMRKAQKAYTQQRIKATTSGDRVECNAAAQLLVQKNRIEQAVDQTISEILLAGEEAGEA